MELEMGYLRSLVERGGPSEQDYSILTNVIKSLSQRIASNEDNALSQELTNVMGDAISLDTMQGFVFQKPHGYAGDFEIIERIYDQYLSPKEELKNWDAYFHQASAAKAVINRKTYFKSLLRDIEKHHSKANILNVASGPARDIFEYYLENPDSDINFECVDQDTNAIEFASSRCRFVEDKVNFNKANALYYKTDKTFDLVWSAGLFDYFNDTVFVKALKRLSKYVKSNGELVVGNFCKSNPNRHYMELLNWQLHHRTSQELISLAKKAGFSDDQLSIGKEVEGVNLFLHIQIPG